MQLSKSQNLESTHMEGGDAWGHGSAASSMARRMRRRRTASASNSTGRAPSADPWPRQWQWRRWGGEAWEGDRVAGAYQSRPCFFGWSGHLDTQAEEKRLDL